MRTLTFAGNWKMHLGPAGASAFLERFLADYRAQEGREVWFFAPAVSLSTVASALTGVDGVCVGIQNVHWEREGAFTGETSAAMAAEGGATAALIGHSERRHVFGETDEETGRKVRAVLDADMLAVLCVGETLAEREHGETLTVVRRQLQVLAGLALDVLRRVVIAYEPVWAIGTGRNASPADAAEVHGAIRRRMGQLGAAADDLRILYGGSVKPGNVAALLAEPQIDGVLVGGASLDPESWRAIVATGRD